MVYGWSPGRGRSRILRHAAVGETRRDNQAGAVHARAVTDHEAITARLEAALEMWDDGVQIKRESLRRSDPSASDAELDARIGVWLAERAGEDHGDRPLAAGPPRSVPR